MLAHILSDTRIEPPADFPVTWPQAEDAQRYWTRDREHLPDPMTPLCFSTNAEMFPAARQPAVTLYDEAVLDIQGRRINTYLYMHLVTASGTPEEMSARAKRNRARLSAVSLRLGELWATEWLPELRGHFAFWDSFDLTQADFRTLCAHLDETLRRYQRLWELHYLFAPPMWFAIHEFENFYADLFPGSTPLDAHRLLQGFDNKTLEMGRALWQLSRSARGVPAVRQIICERPAAEVCATLDGVEEGRTFLQDLRAFLREHGCRSDLWDWGCPSWEDDPTPVINNLKNYLAQPDRDLTAELQAAAAEREGAIAAAREVLSRYPRAVRERFEQILPAAQHGLVLTENHTYYLDFNGFGRIHRGMREFGRRFAREKRLQQPCDIFYLFIDELRELLRQPDWDMRDLTAQRRAEMEYWRSYPEPIELGTRPAKVAPLYSPEARRIQKYMNRLNNDVALNTEVGHVLCGQAGSSGKVIGPARVIDSLAEAQRVRPGDILVTTTTAPSWTPLFLTAAAVVTDAGGMLSHSAVVAREYHIPAVVGTRYATARIADGQLIEVDGNAGKVTLL